MPPRRPDAAQAPYAPGTGGTATARDAVVRQAEPTEAEEIGVLTERVYREGGHTDDAYSAELLDAASRVREAIVLVGVLDHRLVGSVTLAPPASRYVEISRPDEMEVRMLAVAPDARRQGIAGLLMTEAEARARRLGLAGVVLSTEPHMHAAHRLYERRGYRRRPQRDWTIRDFALLAYRLDLR